MFCRSVLLKSNSLFLRIKRTFLSKNYKCLPEWESRLASPIMQKVKLDALYYEIDQSFNQTGKANPIDIDIFINKVNDDSHVDEIADLMHRLRKTEETSNCLESTGHALIRIFADNNRLEELIQILDEPLEYGVFLDHYIANYIISDCIEKKNFRLAARIATFLMLQEDFDNELARNLALYSCYNYLSDPEPFYSFKEQKDEDPKEEIKVRVKYVRNEYFDDHFDLKNHKHLVGKTMSMIGIKMENNFGKNIHLLGAILYQKYENAIKILKTSDPKIFYKDILEESLKFLDIDLNENAKANELHALLKEMLPNKNLIQDDFKEKMNEIVKNAVTKNEPLEIEAQQNIYTTWNELRNKRFNDELNRLQRVERLRQIEKLTEEMKNEEEKLWFFENEEKINLKIDDKKVSYPKRWFGKKKKPRVVDEGYIPPEINKPLK